MVEVVVYVLTVKLHSFDSSYKWLRISKQAQSVILVNFGNFIDKLIYSIAYQIVGNSQAVVEGNGSRVERILWNRNHNLHPGLLGD